MAEAQYCKQRLDVPRIKPEFNSTLILPSYLGNVVTVTEISLRFT